MLLCMTRASLAADQLGVPNEGLPTDLAQLIQAIFSWSINIIGLVIFVQFFRAGFKWFTSRGNSSSEPLKAGSEMMKNAALGAVVLFSTWLILNTINPD